jgi:hypothetical protein
MLRRRHLNDFQKAELAIPLLEIERELAKQRHRELSSKLVGKLFNTLASDDAKVSHNLPTKQALTGGLTQHYRVGSNDHTLPNFELHIIQYYIIWNEYSSKHEKHTSNPQALQYQGVSSGIMIPHEKL